MRCIVLFDCACAWGESHAELRYASALDRSDPEPLDWGAAPILGKVGMLVLIGIDIPSSRLSGASVCIESAGEEGIEGIEDIGGAAGAGCAEDFAMSDADC